MAARGARAARSGYPEGQLANFSSGGGRIWPDIVFCTLPPGLGRKRIAMPRFDFA
jgi:hypothetical protein